MSDPQAVVSPDDAEYVPGVRCVVMDCCGFTFDANHTDDNEEGSYTCPCCAPVEVAPHA